MFALGSQIITIYILIVPYFQYFIMPRKRKVTAKKRRSQNREQYGKRSSNQDLSDRRLKAKADYYANHSKSLA